MDVILDFSALYLLGVERGKYPVRLDQAEPDLADCIKTLAEQHPGLFESLRRIGILKDDELNAMVISGQQLLKSESKIREGQVIKFVGQISGG